MKENSDNSDLFEISAEHCMETNKTITKKACEPQLTSQTASVSCAVSKLEEVGQ